MHLPNAGSDEFKSMDGKYWGFAFAINAKDQSHLNAIYQDLN